tara:strand:+ start:6159 stop:6317 length:159 start_codon:yes stop_codon:yes gene_type:complete
MKHPFNNPYVAIPLLLLCFAKIASHFVKEPTPTAIVVAVSEDATVQFVPEGE